MLVITRFRVPSARADVFADDLSAVVEAFRTRPGLVDAFVGRNLDDATLWTLTTRWEGVGAYRRALSAYDVKVATAAPYALALEEPAAYTDAYDDIADVAGDATPPLGNR
ncbi:antibiotic biosynthesis monooxygenase [Mumia sp. zg.B21]|uniref:antibiotic biosynthesis monooxygenase family protein n=1 Tax=Mumia sp. zg.B21 TaxID=2855447 RepID=UPI001C6EDFEA|nr:antibiotic biosynthesis monooxygenase family protein [Mumia sp. zg.B21]MBW9208381.1 antibiotic biosynthesis monooxygenase [Mumia sp. zg.B21]